MKSIVVISALITKYLNHFYKIYKKKLKNTENVTNTLWSLKLTFFVFKPIVHKDDNYFRKQTQKPNLKGQCQTWNPVNKRKKSMMQTNSFYLISNGVSLSVISDVLVFSDAVVSAGGLFLDDDAILLGSGMTETAVAHVEPLLLQNLGKARVPIELGGTHGHWGKEQNLKKDKLTSWLSWQVLAITSP